MMINVGDEMMRTMMDNDIGEDDDHHDDRDDDDDG